MSKFWKSLFLCGIFLCVVACTEKQIEVQTSYVEVPVEKPIEEPTENIDSDDDKVLDKVDNCVYVKNPAQEDFDGDGEGDICDSMDKISFLAGRYDIAGNLDGKDSVSVAAALGLDSISLIPDLNNLPADLQIAYMDAVSTFVMHPDGKRMFFSGFNFPTIRSWNESTGEVKTWAGAPRSAGVVKEGRYLNAKLPNTGGMAIHKDGRYIILPQRYWNCIVVADIETLDVKIFAGECSYELEGDQEIDLLDSSLVNNKMILNYPASVVYDANEMLFVLDLHNKKIRWIYSQPETPQTVSKSGTFVKASDVYEFRGLYPDSYTYTENGIEYHRLYYSTFKTIGYIDYSYHPGCIIPSSSACKIDSENNPEKLVVNPKGKPVTIMSVADACGLSSVDKLSVNIYGIYVAPINGVKSLIYDCLGAWAHRSFYSANELAVINGIYSVAVNDAEPAKISLPETIYDRRCYTEEPIAATSTDAKDALIAKCSKAVFAVKDGPLESAYVEAAPGVLVKDNILYIGEGLDYANTGKIGGAIRVMDLSLPLTERGIYTKLGLPNWDSTGYLDGNGTESRFKKLYGAVIDYDKGADKAVFYVSDYGNNVIRKGVISNLSADIKAGKTPSVQMSTVAGKPHLWDYSTAKSKYETTQEYKKGDYNFADNPEYVYDAPVATEAYLYGPTYLALSHDKKSLFFASVNGVLQKLNLATQELTLVAGYPDVTLWKTVDSINHSLFGTSGIAYDVNKDGDEIIYVSFSWGSEIVGLNLTKRKIENKFGEYGVQREVDGDAGKAKFNQPCGISAVKVGDEKYLYVASFGGNTIRRIDLLKQAVSTVTGNKDYNGFLDGPVSKALWDGPYVLSARVVSDSSAVGVSDSNVVVSVVDYYNSAVRELKAEDVRTMVGSGFVGSRDGKGAESSLGFIIEGLACTETFCLATDTNSIRIIH